MKKVRNQPITGSYKAQKFSPPVKTTSNTSADGEKLVAQPTYPFKSKFGPLNPTGGPKAPGGVSTLEPNIQSGMKHSNLGARALPSGGPIGQKKMPNQSFQIGGRTSVAKSPSKAGSVAVVGAAKASGGPIRGAMGQGHMSGSSLAKIGSVGSSGASSGGPGSANPMAGQQGRGVGVPSNALQAGGRNPNLGERGRGGEFSKPNRKGKGAAFYGE